MQGELGWAIVQGYSLKKLSSTWNMEESKALTTSNQLEKKQQKRCQCGSIKHLLVASKDCPVGLSIRNSKKLALGMGLSQSEAEKAAEEDPSAEEERKCL